MNPYSCIMHHASCFMHHESCIMNHASCIMHHASCIMLPSTHRTPHASSTALPATLAALPRRLMQRSAHLACSVGHASFSLPPAQGSRQAWGVGLPLSSGGLNSDFLGCATRLLLLAAHMRPRLSLLPCCCCRSAFACTPSNAPSSSPSVCQHAVSLVVSQSTLLYRRALEDM